LYFDNELVVTEIAPTDEPIFYEAGSAIVLNKMANFSPSEPTEYHRVATYNRVLSQGEVNTIYNQIVQPTPVEEGIDPIDPNLLFDVNFNGSSLDVDYST
jgi:hypothetical protein